MGMGVLMSGMAYKYPPPRNPNMLRNLLLTIAGAWVVVVLIFVYLNLAGG